MLDPFEKVKNMDDMGDEETGKKDMKMVFLSINLLFIVQIVQALILMAALIKFFT